MAFPPDALSSLSDLEQEAHSCMKRLLYSDPENPERLTLPDQTQVDITVATVGLVPLFGSCESLKLLALFSPSDPFTPVALHLKERWWKLEEVLRSEGRDGLLQVQTLCDRIVLYVLNRIVYRVQERNPEELPFLCHSHDAFAKILWSNGHAVGFYSVRPAGSACGVFSTRTIPLPVLDSLFVRKSCRGDGLGLRMLQDYVGSFKEDQLGLRYPLTKTMYRVCRRFLQLFPGDTDLLWEVDSSRLDHRVSVASRIQTMSLTGGGSVRHSHKDQEAALVSLTNGSGPKDTEEISPVTQIREEVTLKIITRDTDLTEEKTENGTDIFLTELEDEAMFEEVSSLLRSEEESKEESKEESEVKTASYVCSSQITVENVAAQVEDSLQSPEHLTEERALRSCRKVVNLPQPPCDVEVDTDKLQRRPLRSQHRVLERLRKDGAEEPELGEETVHEDDEEVEGEEAEERREEEPSPAVVETAKAEDTEPKESELEAAMETSVQAAPTPRATRSSKMTIEIVEITTIKRGRKSTGRRQVCRTEATEEVQIETSEQTGEDVEKEIPAQDEDDGTSKDEPVKDAESVEVTETKDKDSEEVSKDQEPALVEEDSLSKEEEKIKTDTIVKEAAVGESTSAEAVEEGKEGSEPKTVMESNVDKTDVDKEPETESAPEEATEKTPVIETRSLRRGQKTVTSNQTVQPETQDEEPEMEQDSTEEQSKEATEPSSEAVEGDEAQIELKVPTEFLKSDSTPTNEKTPEECLQETLDSAVITEETQSVAPTEQENLSSCETEEVVETRSLRSGARTSSTVLTPRTTRGSKLKTEIVETTMTPKTKRGRKSTGRKQVSRSKALTQDLQISSAEDEATEAVQIETEQTTVGDVEVALPAKDKDDGTSKDEPVKDSESAEVTESRDTDSEEISKDREPALVEEEEIKTDTTVEEPAVGESTSAEAIEEGEEESSTAVEETVCQSTEAVDKEQTEVTVEMDKDSQPETVMEPTVEEAEQEKGPEPESAPEEVTEATPVASLTVQPETQEEEPEKEQVFTEELSTEAADPSSEAVEGDGAQIELKVTTEFLQSDSTPTQDDEKTPEECLQDTPESAVVTEEAQSVAPTEQENLSSSDTEEVVETRTLRSGARTSSTVLTPRTTRSSKRKTEIVETTMTTTTKRGRKSTGRKQVSRSKAQTQDLQISSAEDEATEEVQIETSEQTTLEDVEMELPAQDEGNGTSKDEPVKDSESAEVTESKDTDSEEVSKDQEPALVEEEEIKADTTVEEAKTTNAEAIEDGMEKSSTAVGESSCAEAVEKGEEESSPVVEEAVCQNTEAVHNKQTEVTVEMNKDSQPETMFEPTVGKSDQEKELEPESAPEEVTEATPVVETDQPETQTEEVEHEQGSSEEQSAEPSSVTVEEDAPSETRITTEVLSGETEEVVKTRTLRSGAITSSTVLTPRTTRGSKRKTEIVETTTTITKRGRKSTGRKRVSRSQAQTQDLQTSSAEDEATEEVQIETSEQKTVENLEMALPAQDDKDGSGKEEPVKDSESAEVTETKDTSSKVTKDQEPELMEEDSLNKEEEEIKTDTTVEEAAVEESTSAEAIEEGEEKSSTAVEEAVCQSTEAVDQEQTDVTVEMDKDSEPETVMEPTVEEAEQAKGPEPESSPEEVTEATPVVETVQPETQEEEPEKEQVSTEEQPTEAAEPSSEVVEEDEAQIELKVPTEFLQSDSTPTKDDEKTPEECLQETTESVVVTEEAQPVAPTDQENLSSSEMEEVVETRTLRSGARTSRTVLTPRTTRSSKLKSEIVETTMTPTTKRGRKSTGRKRASRSKALTQDLQISSAEDEATEEVQIETSEQTTVGDVELALPAQDEDDGTSKDEPVKDSESAEVTESKDTDSEEVSKDQIPALVEEEEIKTDTIVEEAAVGESTGAEAVEEGEEESSTAVEEAVFQSIEAVDKEQTEVTVEMDKDSQPETVMEPTVEEADQEKGPEPESSPEEITEAKPVVKTDQPETQPQEVEHEQGSSEEQSAEPSSVTVEEDAPSETRITTEVSSAETEEVVETSSTVLTPRTTRGSKRKTEIVETTTTITKRGRNSTGRKQVSRSKAQTQDLQISSAEDEATEEVQIETSEQTTVEDMDMALPAQDDEDGTSKDEPVKDSESAEVTETKKTSSEEVSKDQEPELVEEDSLNKEEEEMKTDTTVEEAESTSAVVIEEGEEESSTAVVESSCAEAVEEESEEAEPAPEELPETESILETDQPKSQEAEPAEPSSEAVEGDAQSETGITTEVPLELPRVTVVLVDLNKVQVVNSTVNSATLQEPEDVEEAQKLEEDACTKGDQGTGETDQQEQADLEQEVTEEADQDHALPLENADSSSNEAEDQMAEGTSQVSVSEEDVEVPATPSKRGKRTVKKTPRRSSRRRPKVDYYDNDLELESLASEDNAISLREDQTSEKVAAEAQSDEESSQGFVLSLRLDEEEEREPTKDELVFIAGKNLRSRSIPSLLISPHSRSGSQTTAEVTAKGSPEQTPRRKRSISKPTPRRASKRQRK